MVWRLWELERSGVSVVASGIVVLASLLAFSVNAEEPADRDPFEEPDLASLVGAVSEGTLRFLPDPPTGKVHRHFNWIEIMPGSLQDGWVHLRQCHESMDEVPRAEIVYRPDGIRKLVVVETRNIGKARVEGHAVQLEGVQTAAHICIEAESLALSDVGDGVMRLRNGPYMRRFLDGYYPMEVLVEVRYPPALLRLVGIYPAPRPGAVIEEGDGRVALSFRFEGRLFTCLDFVSSQQSPPQRPSPSCTSEVPGS